MQHWGLIHLSFLFSALGLNLFFEPFQIETNKLKNDKKYFFCFSFSAPLLSRQETNFMQKR
jgi:hypothetical protein